MLGPRNELSMMQEYNGLVKQHSTMKSKACNQMKCSRKGAENGDCLLLVLVEHKCFAGGHSLCLLYDLFTTATVATALFRTDQISHLLCRLIFCPQK